MTSTYDFKCIERKWIQRWREKKVHRPDLYASDRPFYNLMMFPYPSAEGLHVGNVFAFVGSDIQGRYRKALGYDVFEPMGFDAFGIHSENYALKTGTHPWHMIPQNIRRFRETQLEQIGNMYDWSHEVNTTDPKYYRWTQWIFLKLFEAGLAYRKKEGVNWCPACRTVLANEQVENQKCERCDTIVETRSMEQWFFGITTYAQRLLDNLAWIDWSATTKTAQRNWIGRSEGAEIVFDVENSDKNLMVFTTRPDTLWGVTFLALALEHPYVSVLTKPHKKADMDRYIENRGELERLAKMKLPEQPPWIVKSEYANGTRMYNKMVTSNSLFMVLPVRARVLPPMSYDQPIATEYWDNDGSVEFKEMFTRIEREGVVLVE